jgi:PPOX class probable F420-dependent enzyme
MAAVLSDDLKKYIDETKVYATVATVQPDGRPHLTVVWLVREGDDVLFSTTVNRQQGRNLARDPRVTIMILPPDDPFRYAEIRGSASVVPDPERTLPDRLAMKYVGKPYREFNPASLNDGERIIIRVTPDKIIGRLGAGPPP